MIKFLICTVLPPGSSRVDQTDKFDDFLNLVQLFPKIPYSVLIELKVVGHSVINNFELQSTLLRYTVFTPRVSEVGKIQPFRRKNRFLVNFRGS